MSYIQLNADGTYTGVEYSEFNKTIRDDRAQYGQIIIKDNRPTPKPTENELGIPVYPVHPDFGTPKFDELIAKIYIPKLTIRRRLRAAGLEQAADTALDSQLETRRDWDDSIEIDSQDPAVINLLTLIGANVSEILAED